MSGWNRETTCAGLMLDHIDFSKKVKGYRDRHLSESEAEAEIESEIRQILDQAATKVIKATRNIDGSDIFVNFDIRIDYKALAEDVIDTYWDDARPTDAGVPRRIDRDRYNRAMNELPPLTIPRAALESVSPPCTSGFMSSEAADWTKTGHTLYDAYGERRGPNGPEYLYLGQWTMYGEAASSSKKRSGKVLLSKRRSG